MAYVLDGKSIDFNEKKKLPLLAKGKNGNVYCYGNSALKVFNNIEEPPISLETTKYLTTVNTERILLPRKILFYDDAFSGYSLKLVPKKGNEKKLINSPKEQLIENIVALEGDIYKISRKNILLSDMSPENVKYNGGLYISDPSKYTILDLPKPGDMESELEKINKFQLHLLLTELFSEELRKINYTKDAINRLKEMFALRDLDQNPSDFLNDIMDGQNTIKEMVKKINR